MSRPYKLYVVMVAFHARVQPVAVYRDDLEAELRANQERKQEGILWAEAWVEEVDFNG